MHSEISVHSTAEALGIEFAVKEESQDKRSLMQHRWPPGLCNYRVLFQGPLCDWPSYVSIIAGGPFNLMADAAALLHPGLFLTVARNFQEHAQGSTYIIPPQPLPLALWALVLNGSSSNPSE